MQVQHQCLENNSSMQENLLNLKTFSDFALPIYCDVYVFVSFKVGKTNILQIELNSKHLYGSPVVICKHT